MSHPYIRPGGERTATGASYFPFLWRVCHSACSSLNEFLFYPIIFVIFYCCYYCTQLPVDLLSLLAGSLERGGKQSATSACSALKCSNHTINPFTQLFKKPFLLCLFLPSCKRVVVFFLKIYTNAQKTLFKTKVHFLKMFLLISWTKVNRCAYLCIVDKSREGRWHCAFSNVAQYFPLRFLCRSNSGKNVLKSRKGRKEAEKSPYARSQFTTESWRNASVSPLHGRGWLTDFVLAGYFSADVVGPLVI